MTPVDDLITAAIQFGALGIVAVGAHYILTKTIPNMISLFANELKEQRLVHNTAEKEKQNAFLLSLEKQREDFRNIVDKMYGAQVDTAKEMRNLTSAVSQKLCPVWGPRGEAQIQKPASNAQG